MFEFLTPIPALTTQPAFVCAEPAREFTPVYLFPLTQGFEPEKINVRSPKRSHSQVYNKEKSVKGPDNGTVEVPECNCVLQ